MISETCEACECASVEAVDPCDDEVQPYRVCSNCQRRLHARELRPLEWFNLAKRHGLNRFLLHDDFYDERGNAMCPENKVERSKDFPSPTFSKVARSAALLLDFTIAQWHYTDKLKSAWAALSKSEVLGVLSERYISTRNQWVHDSILEVCASALKNSGADLVRRAWEGYPEEASIQSLGMASAECLPLREGLDRVKAALAELEEGKRRDEIFALSYFKSPEVFDWLEEHIFPPITDTWGRMVAVTGVDWPRLRKWLQGGRPLSLVALDALLEIRDPQTLRAKRSDLALANAPSREEFESVLRGYADVDRVPRVEFSVKSLLESSGELVVSG